MSVRTAWIRAALLASLAWLASGCAVPLKPGTGADFSALVEEASPALVTVLGPAGALGSGFVVADSGLVARRLGELRLVNCASPAYLERHGVPLAVADLKHHLAVNYASPLSGKIDDWEYIDNGRSVRVPMRSQVSVNNAEAYIACCLAGLGMIQIPAYDVQDDLASGRLVEVLPAWRAASMPISVLYPHRQHRSRRVQAFVEWAAALLVERMMLNSR